MANTRSFNLSAVLAAVKIIIIVTNIKGLYVKGQVEFSASRLKVDWALADETRSNVFELTSRLSFSGQNENENGEREKCSVLFMYIPINFLGSGKKFPVPVPFVPISNFPDFQTPTVVLTSQTLFDSKLKDQKDFHFSKVTKHLKCHVNFGLVPWDLKKSYSKQIDPQEIIRKDFTNPILQGNYLFSYPIQTLNILWTYSYISERSRSGQGQTRRSSPNILDSIRNWFSSPKDFPILVIRTVPQEFQEFQELQEN